MSATSSFELKLPEISTFEQTSSKEACQLSAAKVEEALANVSMSMQAKVRPVNLVAVRCFDILFFMGIFNRKLFILSRAISTHYFPNASSRRLFLLYCLPSLCKTSRLLE
jgi:hypothetical protein